jgi:hypothetical protein
MDLPVMMCVLLFFYQDAILSTFEGSSLRQEPSFLDSPGRHPPKALCACGTTCQGGWVLWWPTSVSGFLGFLSEEIRNTYHSPRFG